MTDEQRQILRRAAEADKDNCISIAILRLLDLVEEQKKRIAELEDLLTCHDRPGGEE